MEILKHEIKYSSRSTVFRLYGIGDIHRGNAGFDEQKLNEVIEQVRRDPRALWLGMGDYAECINIDDKRFDPASIDPTYNIKSLSRLIDYQVDDTVNAFLPIKKKCIGLLTGNHEETVRLRYHRDPLYEIAKRLDLLEKVMGYDGFIRLEFKRQTGCKGHLPGNVIIIYASHGFGGSRKSGAKINRLEDVAGFMDADIIMMGHEHKKVITPPILKLGLDHFGNLRQTKQYGVMTGSFLKSYVEKATNYSEKSGYSPNDLGTVCITIKPDIKDIRPSL